MAGPEPTVRSVCEHTFVRWSNLSLETEERTRLPGYRDEARVRHFEAPEAIPTRFYEVRAKSILNRVPQASRDAVSLDDQPVPGLHPRLRLLRDGAARRS